VVLACVAFERFSPLKAFSPFLPEPGGVSPPSLRRKLFWLAQAWISVPSTEKCSLDKSRFTSGRASSSARKRCATSPASSRSRFFEKLLASHTGSSTPSPTNQRNKRSNSSRSISCRSERTE
jgi:hypothetical protein